MLNAAYLFPGLFAYTNGVEPAEMSNGITPRNYAYPFGNVRRYGAVGDGSTNDTAAFTAARTVTGGNYHVPSGTFLVDASPSVWLDTFTAGDSAFIKISSTTYEVSHAFAGPWRYVAGSATLLKIRHAVSGNDIIQIQDGGPGTATYFQRGLAFNCDSHFIQAKPATNNGSCDILLQRSAANADPDGNRFNITFDENLDRFQISYATTASGSPSFDAALQVYAGTAPSMVLPALQPQFNQGWSIKQRASGGFELEATVSSTAVTLRNKGTPANVNMTFGDGTLGFYGATASAKPTVTGSRGGNAALASLLSAGATLGLWTDSSTA